MKKKLIRPLQTLVSLLLIASLNVTSQPIASTKITTVKSGLWSDPSVWTSLRIPNQFDSIYISHPIFVDIDAECSYLEAKSLQLSINPGKSLKVMGSKPILRSTAFIVDSSALKLASNNSELIAGIYKYKFIGSKPDISLGKILVGDINKGYLRKVTGVNFKGDTAIVQTVQGTMEEVFEKAHFSIYYDGESMEDDSFLVGGTSPLLHSDPAKFRYNITKQTMLEYGLSRIDLTNATIDLYPSFQFDYDFGISGLSLFEMKMKDALLHAEMEFDLKLGAGQKSKDTTLKRFTKLFKTIVAGVPVILEAELLLLGKAEVEMSGVSFDRIFKYQFDYKFDANARYENDSWSTGFSQKSFKDTLTYEDKTNLNAQVNVNFTITPKLSFRIYSIAGPNIEFPTGLSLNGRYNHDGGSWDLGIAAKSELNWGADIKIGKITVDNYGPYNLWTKEWFNYKIPFRLVKISGNGQTITDTLSYLQDFIKVQVLDSKDKFWSNVPVFFQLRQPGTLSAQKVFTDDSGYARIQWKPGTDSLQILNVFAKNGAGENITNSPDSFFAKYGVDTLKVIKVFDMSNTPAFTTNFFKTVGIGKGGYIYAGTINNGLYKYVDTNWTRLSVLTNNNINDIQTDKNGGLWIAQYGASGAQANNGGINYFPDSTSVGFTYYGAILGAPTRNARGVFIDTSRTNGGNRPRLWTAHMAHITGGVSTTGAIGLGMNESSPFFNRITNGVDIALQNGSIQSIGGNSEEVWAYASVNFGRSQILRYAAVNGSFLGAYDFENTIVPSFTSNFNARAIYFDKTGTKWLGMFTGGIVAKENENWININMPEVFPAATSISTNGISEGKFGKIFIATSQGLVIYYGGDKLDPASYKRITTEHGLPSNNVLDVIERLEDGILVVSTGSGIAFVTGH